jgi:hypothetical protein
MTPSLERKIRDRANNACEYCLMPQSAFVLTFPIDHIIARQHGGKTRADNLALACLRCNLHKGPNIAGIDPVSKQVVPLYHPRRDRWGDHFRWRGPRLAGLTPVARATIRVLDMNDRDSVAIRKSLIAEGMYPPR